MELENRMISAEWLKTKLYEICDEYNTCLLHIDRIIDEIDDAPDVEVVLCKDCRYYNEDGEYCGMWGECRHPEHYCGEGVSDSND